MVNIDLEIFIDLCVSSIPEHKGLVFGMLSVSLIMIIFVPMCVSTIPLHLIDFTFFFRYLKYSLMIYRCSVNINVLALRARTKLRFPRKRLQRFWLHFSNLWWPFPYIKLHMSYLQRNNDTSFSKKKNANVGSYGQYLCTSWFWGSVGQTAFTFIRLVYVGKLLVYESCKEMVELIERLNVTVF
jgi:hypothetical protein